MISSLGRVSLLLLLLVFLPACPGTSSHSGSGVTLVFKHGKIAGDPEPFRQVLEGFERENPGIHIKDEPLPSSTDEQHQFYVINLEGGEDEFDVFAMDVIWVPEFIRAGWLKDITPLLPPAERKDFFEGPLKAVTSNDRVFALPWYIDAGVLYYRKDLLSKYGFAPPTTWAELVRIAETITRSRPELYGYIWQGKQYEGLVCNVLEILWSNGGGVLQDGRIVIDSPENVEALTFMRELITRYRITPPLVTTATEEPTRHLFGQGKAIFLRNWPYAWNLFQREDSPVKGCVGVAPLPSFPGYPSASTLGGWQLGINRFSRHPHEAERFLRYMTSYKTQKLLSLAVGYKPTRKALYHDETLIQAQPFIAGLYRIFTRARPRPVTPYYMMLSQVMQPEFSAILTGVKKPEEALQSAKKQMEFILDTDKISR
jgi:multiple sugar transport system substrate-binding protein